MTAYPDIGAFEYTPEPIPTPEEPSVLVTGEYPQPAWTTLVEIDWDGGTGYYSFDGIAAPTRFYEDWLLSVGSIDRQVDPVPFGFMIANCVVELDNSSGYFSELKAEQAFRNRTVRIKFGDAATGYSSIVTVYSGQITSWSISNYRLTLNIQDHSGEFFKDTIDGRLNHTDFVDLPAGTEPKLLPIAFGALTSVGELATGIIPCYLIDPAVTDPLYTFLVSRHPCYAVSNVWVAGVLQVLGVDYSVATGTYGSYADCQLVKLAQPSTQPVTADVVGYTTPTALYYPADVIQLFLTEYCGVPVWDLDADLFAAAKAVQLSPYEFLTAVWIGDESKTIQDYLDWFAETFNLSIFRTKEGLLGLYQFSIATQIDAEIDVDITEDDIAGFSVSANSEVCSRLQANYFYNWVSDYFHRQPSKTDYIAEDELGQAVRENVNQRCANTDLIANRLRLERRFLMRENVQFCRLTLPPEYAGDLDLNQWVTITHPQGPAEDGLGYRQKQARIVGIRLQPSALDPSITIECQVLDRVRASDIYGCVFYVTAKYIANDPVDGEIIASWTDCSESGYNALQATGANKPVYRADGGPDNKPYVEFDGSDDYVATAASPLNGATEFAWIVVFRCTASGNQAIAVESDGANVKQGFYAVDAELRFTVSTGTSYAAGAIEANRWHIARAVHADTVMPAWRTTLYIDGVEQATQGNTNTGAYAIPVILGARADGTWPLNGGIAECMIFNSYATDAELRAVEAGLADRYGIDLNA